MNLTIFLTIVFIFYNLTKYLIEYYLLGSERGLVNLYLLILFIGAMDCMFEVEADKII